MLINLTLQDMISLAMNQKLEKDDVTLTPNRPILTSLKVSPRGDRAEITYFIDETDPQASAQM
jgi:hypothetical protein